MTMSEICYVDADNENYNIDVDINYFQACHMTPCHLSLFVISTNVLILRVFYRMAQNECPYVNIDVNSSLIAHDIVPFFKSLSSILFDIAWFPSSPTFFVSCLSLTFPICLD